MATIYDIAKHVGVSAGTVSRALSRPDKVLPATRARIEQAAAALGYVPNTVARTLKTQRSGKILVTVPDIANPFFAQILQGAEDAAQAVGYAVLLGDTQDQPDREERYAQMLRRNEADGMIVLGGSMGTDLALDASAVLPLGVPKFIVSTIALSFGLVGAGALDLKVAGASLLALLPALAGMWFGQAIRQRITAATFKLCFFAGLLALGGYLVARALL